MVTARLQILDLEADHEGGGAHATMASSSSGPVASWRQRVAQAAEAFAQRGLALSPERLAVREARRARRVGAEHVLGARLAEDRWKDLLEDSSGEGGRSRRVEPEDTLAAVERLAQLFEARGADWPAVGVEGELAFLIELLAPQYAHNPSAVRFALTAYGARAPSALQRYVTAAERAVRGADEHDGCAAPE